MEQLQGPFYQTVRLTHKLNNGFVSASCSAPLENAHHKKTEHALTGSQAK